jgi:glc operon protein GlcG
MALTLDEANRIAHAVVVKAEELGINITVAICDSGGRLVAFSRMDGAGWAGVYAAQGKALTSAAFGAPSSRLQGGADTPLLRGIAEAEGGNMIMHGGAMPIVRDGVVVGACGVSGASVEAEEDCIDAGLAAL